MRKTTLPRLLFLVLALLPALLAHAQFSPAVSRELTVFNNPLGGAGVLIPDAASREFTVFNGSLSGTVIPDAVSREFSIFNGTLSGTVIPDAVSRELSVFNSPFGGPIGVLIPDAVSREFTLVNAAASEVDFREPDTQIVSGALDGACVDNSTAAFTWTGSDDTTPTPLLQYAYRLDGAAWSDWTPATTTSFASLADGTHTFEVKARDLAGNEDATPAARRFHVVTTPLVITEVKATPSATGCVIPWNTNREANAEVEYGPTTDYGSRKSDAPFIRQHKITLSGLMPETIYHFRVRSTDECGNTATSGDFIFQTLARTDTTPPDTSITEGPAQDSTISTNDTQFRFTGTDDVTPTADLKYQWRLDGEDWSGPDGNTTVSLSNLADGSHTFEVAAIDAAGNVDPTPATRGFAVDTTVPPPPVLPDLIVKSVQAADQVMAGMSLNLGWVDRNEGAGRASRAWIDRIYLSLDDQLDPNVDELIGELSYGDGLDPAQEVTRNASVMIPFTTPPGRYVLIVVTDATEIVDESNEGNNTNTHAIEVQEFQDTTPPDTNFTSGPADNGKACATTVEFCWTATDDATPTGELQYSYKLDDAEWSDWGTNTCHTFSGLAEGPHTLSVRAQDASGNVEPSPAVRNFTVDLTVLTIPNVGVDARDYRATITWTTSKPATSQVEYGLTAEYGSVTSLDPGMVRAHEVTIYNLQPQTTYHYRVKSNDGCNEIISDDLTFTTTEIMPPDLTVKALRFPASATPFSTVDISWTVENRGPGDARGAWADSLYLSQDNVLSADDILLGTFDRPIPLDRNTTYDQTRSLSLPRLASGTYYLILKTDSGNTLGEAEEDNNVLARPIGILKVQSLIAAPSPIVLTLVPGQPFQGQLDLTNLDTEVLGDITATVEGAAANIIVQVDAPAFLAGMQTRQVPYTVSATNDTVLQSAPILRFRSSSGQEAIVTLNLTVAPLRPNLIGAPSSLGTGMVRGRQTLVEFTITNTGSVAATNLQVSLPAAPWLFLVTPENIGDLAPGEAATITLSLQPAANLPLGPYTGTIAVNGQNISLQVGFAFLCISEGKGDLTILSEDEFTYFSNEHPPVAYAKVVLKNPYTDAIVLEDATDERGVFTQRGIPEGVYNLEVTAGGHSAHRSAVQVVAGEERLERAFLQRELVTYQWNVVPINIGDEYTVRLEAIFEAHIPAPVVTISPKVLDLSKVSFDASGKAVVYYTITNHGLIAAEDVTFTFPADSDYKITPAIESLGSLKALSSVVVPVTIQRGDLQALGGPRIGSLSEPGEGFVRCFINGLLHFKYLCDVYRSGFDDVVIAKPPQVSGCSFNIGIPAPSDPHPGSGSGSGSGGNSPGLQGPSEFVVPAACEPCYWNAYGKFVLCIGLEFLPLSRAAKCVLTVYRTILGGCYTSGESTPEDALNCLADIAIGCVWEVPGASLVKCFIDLALDLRKCESSASSSRSPLGFDYPQVGVLSGGGVSPQIIYLELQTRRLAALVDLYVTWFGDEKWLSGDVKDPVTLKPFMEELHHALDVRGEERWTISLSERARLLAIPLPRHLTVADVVKLIDRWNRTVDYYKIGIFTAADVPAGQSTDFIARDVIQDKLRSAHDSVDASIAEGFTGLYEGMAVALEAVKEKYNIGSQDEGVCAKVRVRLDQRVALTRTAFQATLEISNSPENVKIENVRIVLNIQDAQGNDATSRFAIDVPVLTGIDRIDGTGSIAQGVTASARWKILPTREAAPEGNTEYFVSGVLSYVQNGIEVNIPLFPTGILVKPDPFLQFHYFWQRDVYGDDPFTPDIEPAEPFSLGLLVVNAGKGAARNMTIETAQPEIVDNEKGLLVDFKIIGTQVNDQEINPALKVNLGDIPGEQTAVARWLMTSTLQGKFIGYSANYKHIDGLGNTRTSLIDSVSTHELEHVVRVDGPSDDKKPDFLANDVPDPGDLPETLYQSDGSVAPVGPITNASVNGPVSESHLQVVLSLSSAPRGFIYIRMNDPASGRFRLLRVVRSDGHQIRLDDNVWTTHRTIRRKGQAPFRQHLLQLFDQDSTGSYTLVYGALGPAQGSVNRLKTLPDGREVVFGSDPNAGSGGGGNNGDGGGTGGGGTGGGDPGTIDPVPSGSLVVTAAFADGMYVEALDRSGGIKIVPGGLPEGVLVAGTGIMRTGANGERYIEATFVKPVGAGSVAPLGIATKPLYSGDFFYDPSTGAGQKGMAGGAGLNTVGLLARTLGRVVAVGSGAFLVDDGYGRPVKVLLPGNALSPPGDSFVLVTGALSTEKVNGELYPVLRPRRSADILLDLSDLQDTFATPPGTLNTGGNLFALPGIPINPAVPAVLDPFDPGGDGSGLHGRLTRYDAPYQSEIFFNAARPDLFGNLLLGEGYRLRLNAGEDSAFGFGGFRSDFADRWISLPRIGATRIGHPFPYPVPLADVRVTDGMKTVLMQQAAKGEFPNWLDSIWEYFDSTNQVSRFLGLPEDAPDSTLLTPWLGYWVISHRDNLALIVPAQNAGPVITSLDPSSATAGGPAFTLKVRGSGFVSASTVLWNDTPRPTAFVSATELTAEIPASDIAAVGFGQVTVANSSTAGGTSGAATFVITATPPQDTTPPTSSVLPLLALTSDPVFTVSWFGQDEVGGSGLKTYDVFVSNNNSPYTRWQKEVTSTSAAFTGAIDHTYKFYSIARDNAGNVEAAPQKPDAVTTVVQGEYPAPTLASLEPDSALAGGPQFTLVVTGTNFVPGCVVRWNGDARRTTFVSATHITAAIPASDIAVAGSALVTVVNPAPGGGTSNAQVFLIGAPNLSVSATLSREGEQIVARVTVTNTGSGPAASVQVTRVTLGDTGTTDPLPALLGQIPPAGSKLIVLHFAAPPAGTRTILRVNGTYAGGTFGGGLRVVVP